MLPKIDGYGVCEVIWQKSDVPNTIFTAFDGEQNQNRELDLQAVSPMRIFQGYLRRFTVLRGPGTGKPASAFVISVRADNYLSLEE